MRLSSITELSAAAMALLSASPVMARPLHVTGCVKQAVVDLSCVEPFAAFYCLEVAEADPDLFGMCVSRAGCPTEEAGKAALAVQQCQTGAEHAGPGSNDDLRRREPLGRRDEPLQSLATLLARSTSSETFNVTISSAIVGIVLGMGVVGSTITICFCCLRESSRKKKAKKAAEEKEALMASSRKGGK
ncbi:hypothetical protein VP1G_04736 [Cytospora mali]|uniref:Extracellular membrane protein CFEM domain-containing protein n=1 Tax=Cytospora mali TaxID=578113 RepID=A0A194V0G0_CYTMA|nr:hypothetical protein VP1G_04736 [Valsa mali var. pyri (nom. inval.)]